MIDEVLAAQRGLHLGIEALPLRGGPLLDGDHGVDGRVAHRGIGVVQVRQQPRQRLAPGQAAQRVHDRPAQHLVVEQLQERRGRARVADLAQGVDGRELEPGLRAQDPDQRGDRVRRSDLPQAGRGGVADVDVGVGEGLDERAAPPAPRAAPPA